MKSSTKKVLVLWFIIGMMYFTLEGCFHLFNKGGYANILMLPVGGLCGVLVGGINQYKKFYNLKIVYQSIIGCLIVTTVEFISGYILNIRLGLNIWDYSNLPLNYKGQICLLFSIIWFILMPLLIWLEDYLRWIFWHEGTPYSISQIYKEFITFK